MEYNSQQKKNVSESSDSLCYLLKENLMTTYRGLTTPKSTNGPGHLFSNQRNPTPIDETVEFGLISSRVQTTRSPDANPPANFQYQQEKF